MSTQMKKTKLKISLGRTAVQSHSKSTPWAGGILQSSPGVLAVPFHGSFFNGVSDLRPFQCSKTAVTGLLFSSSMTVFIEDQQSFHGFSCLMPSKFPVESKQMTESLV